MSAPRSPARRLAPRAGVRAQLFGAAALWLVALSFLLVRGVLFLVDPGPGHHLDSWFVPVALLAAALGVLKARLVLVRYAREAVARIRERGRGCVFGLLGWKSWCLVIGMITAGIAVRSSPLVDVHWGRALLSLVYLAVGTALLLADGVFWRAALTGAGARGPTGPR